MRRIICLMLVLVLCVSMTGVAFASAVNSPGQGGEAPSIPDGGGTNPTTPGDGGDVTPTTPDETTPSTPGGEEPPKTGDTSAVELWLLVMVLALVAMIVILVLDRKYTRK